MTNLTLNVDGSEKSVYDYKDYPIYIRKAFLSSYDGFAAPSHWHDDVEFIVVISGKMQYNVNGEVIEIEENQGIFVNSRALHFGFSSSYKECEFICVRLHPSLICSSDEFERQFVLPVINNADMPFIKLKQDIEWQKSIIDCILKMYLSKNAPTCPLTVCAMLFTIWANIFEHNTVLCYKNDNADLIIIKKIIGYIQNNYQNALTLNDIARSGFIGQSKCCKLFKKYISKTPNEYLTDYRLNKSLKLLKNTNMSVTDIALSVGFNGNSYFAETFKKNFGKTPTEFRANNRV